MFFLSEIVCVSLKVGQKYVVYLVLGDLNTAIFVVDEFCHIVYDRLGKLDISSLGRKGENERGNQRKNPHLWQLRQSIRGNYDEDKSSPSLR